MLRQNTTPQYNNTTVQTQRFNNYKHATHATHYKHATPCNTIQHHSADDNTHTRQRPELRHHPCCCSCGAVRRRCPGRSPAAPCCVRHVLRHFCSCVRYLTWVQGRFSLASTPPSSRRSSSSMLQICQTHNSCFSCSRCLFAAARHLGLDGGDSSSSISSLLLSGAVRLWLAFRFGVGDELPAAPYYSFRVVMWLLKQPVALGATVRVACRAIRSPGTLRGSWASM